jgi:two-component system, response regulator PdtaR
MDHKPRLIVAEDDPLIAWAVRVGLADQGYEVCGWADSAPEAVRLAELHRPDVAVVDFGLADGTDGMMAAREISNRLGIPVVMCSAHADAKADVQAVEGTRDDVAVVGWVSRPYRISDLNRLIAAAVRH